MTITIPVWFLWLLGIVIANVILFFAIMGFAFYVELGRNKSSR